MYDDYLCRIEGDEFETFDDEGWPDAQPVGWVSAVWFLFGSPDETVDSAVHRFGNGTKCEFGRDMFNAALEAHGGLDQVLEKHFRFGLLPVVELVSHFLRYPDHRLTITQSWSE